MYTLKVKCKVGYVSNLCLWAVPREPNGEEFLHVRRENWVLSLHGFNLKVREPLLNKEHKNIVWKHPLYEQEHSGKFSHYT